VNEKTRQELAALKEDKFRHQHFLREGRALPAELTTEQQEEMDKVELHPWDQSFHMSRVRAMQLSSDTGSTLSHYFTVQNVLNGWRILVEKLFGLEMRIGKMEPGETWSRSSSNNSSSSSQEVMKLELWENVAKDASTLHDHSPSSSPSTTSQLVGVIYLDLFARAHKFSNAASFGIRSGCEAAGRDLLMMDASSSTSTHPSSSTRRQIPVVGIVCALSGPQWQGNVHPNQKAARGQVAFLHPTDVETLFHELGHCMHNLLSRTKYQHVAGARGELDFVEMPSTLFESFMTEYEYVKQWARHYQTDAPLSSSLHRVIVSGKQTFCNLDLIMQALVSLYDQKIHGEEMKEIMERHSSSSLQAEGADPKPIEEQRTAAIGAEMSRMYHSLHVTYSPFYHADSTPVSHPYLRLFHLTSYAASYYCYLYCRIFSSLLWKREFAHRALQRELGTRLREELFRYGGGKDAREILAELVGVERRKDGSAESRERQLKQLQEFVEAQIPTFLKSVATTSTKGSK
jgi:intermediate peptidase